MTEVRQRKLHGSPHTEHSIWINGQKIYGQLSPMSEVEVEERIRAHLNPPAVQHVRDVSGKAGRPSKKTNSEHKGFPMGRSAIRVARLAAVKPTPARLFETRPAWAHPHNAAHREAYVAAIAFLRRGKQSRWLCDHASLAPSWRTLPTEETA